MSQPLVSVRISVQSVCRKAVRIICILQQSYNTETIFIKSFAPDTGWIKVYYGRVGRGESHPASKQRSLTPWLERAWWMLSCWARLGRTKCDIRVKFRLNISLHRHHVMSRQQCGTKIGPRYATGNWSNNIYNHFYWFFVKFRNSCYCCAGLGWGTMSQRWRCCTHHCSHQLYCLYLLSAQNSWSLDTWEPEVFMEQKL